MHMIDVSQLPVAHGDDSPGVLVEVVEHVHFPRCQTAGENN